MYGSLIGIVFSSPEKAVQVVPALIVPIIMFGGLFVNLKTIAPYSSWAQYLSPMRYTYSAIVLDQLSSERMHNVIQYEEVQEFMGINGEYWHNVLLLSLLVLSCSILSLLLLYIKKKPI